MAWGYEKYYQRVSKEMKKRKTSLAQNAVLNGIKQACSVLFPLLSFAYCTRILGKDGVGVYSFSQSIVAYFILIAALGIPNYAIREGTLLRDEESKLKQFIDQVFTINCISMVLSFILLVGTVLVVPKLHGYILAIAVLSTQLLLNTIGVDWVNTILEDYLYLTIRYILFQVAAFCCLILFVRTESDVIIYVLITMLANVGGNVLNVFYIRRQGLYPRITRNINLHKHLTPILILFANNIAGVIYLNSDITMLGFFMTEADVGVYYASSKVYTLVKTLINAVIMVTIPRFTYYIGKGQISEYKDKMSEIAGVLLLAVVPCMAGIISEAKTILLLIAGKGYEEGIPVVRMLALAIPVAVFACFFSYSVLIPNKKEKQFMIATIAAATANIMMNLIMIPLVGLVGASITTLVAETIVVSMTIWYSKDLALPKFDLKSVVSVLIGGAAVFGVCFGVELLSLGTIVGFIVKVVLSGIAYAVCLLVFGNRQVIGVLNRIRHRT